MKKTVLSILIIGMAASQLAYAEPSEKAMNECVKKAEKDTGYNVMALTKKVKLSKAEQNKMSKSAVAFNEAMATCLKK